MKNQEAFSLHLGRGENFVKQLMPHMSALHPMRSSAQIVSDLCQATVFAWWFERAESPIAVASCLAVISDDFLDVSDLFVLKHFRRQKLASRLLHAAEVSAQCWGMTQMGLEVRASNLGARSLYQSLNFVEMRRRKSYYLDPVEDALVLQKKVLLTPGS